MEAATELELKQRLAKLNEKDRQTISAYLLRLKHQSESGQKEISRLMKEMDAGKKTRLSDLMPKNGDD